MDTKIFKVMPPQEISKVKREAISGQIVDTQEQALLKGQCDDCGRQLSERLEEKRPDIIERIGTDHYGPTDWAAIKKGDWHFGEAEKSMKWVTGLANSIISLIGGER